jgi:hypothetical protein
MDKCIYNNMDFVYNSSTGANTSNYIIDINKIDKLNELFVIEEYEKAELDASKPFDIDADGGITKINLKKRGKFYNDNGDSIINIIKPRAGAIAEVDVVYAPILGSNPVHYEISDIKIINKGSNYDINDDKDKITIKDTNNTDSYKKINYKRPNLYAFESKKSQCNNTTEQWHKWFTTPYYYLGNRDGRSKQDENDKTRTIIKCYKECENKFIVNKDNFCENITTFEKGRYNNYLPFDPFAIICILGSDSNITKLIITDIYTVGTITNYELVGNYYNTVKNANIKADNLQINTTVKTKILTDIKNYKNYNDITDKDKEIKKIHPVKKIEVDITNAYTILSTYIKNLINNEERNEINIKTIIKNEINKFYILFDKRDELYINYLNKLKDTLHYKRIRYAKDVAYTTTQINGFDSASMNANSTVEDYLIKFYLNYLFQYCIYIYFDNKNIIPSRFLNFGIYENEYLLLNKTNPDDDTTIESPIKTVDTKIYNPISVKIDTKEKNMFDEYLNVYELYKSFIISYPIILIITIIFFMIIYVLYIFNVLYYLTFVINYIYLIIISLIYIVIRLFCCNSFVIGLLTYSMSILYNIAIGIYANVSAFLYYFKFVVILYVLYLVITNQVGYVYDMIIFIFDTIIMIVYSLLLFIVQTIFSKEIYVNLAVIYVIILLYIYYKLWFNFDVDMLIIDKNGNNVKIINEHKNINTIVKTDDIYDAVEIVSQRLYLYKYKYFIDLYEKADTYYSTKVEYLDEQNSGNRAQLKKLKGDQFIIDETNKYKKYVDSNITQIEKIATEKLNTFKSEVEKEKDTKINKEISEKKLKETKDELTKKENELYSKKAENFLINRKINSKINPKINPKIDSDLRKSYENKRNTLVGDISDIKDNIDKLKEEKKSIKEEKNKYDFELSTEKKIRDNGKKIMDKGKNWITDTFSSKSKT